MNRALPAQHLWSARAITTGDAVARNVGMSVYAVAGRLTSREIYLRAAWLDATRAEKEGKFKDSRAPMVALWKFGELFAKRPDVIPGEILTTPLLIDPEDKASGWMGGVRVEDRGIAVSGAPQHYDRLFAAIMHASSTKLFETVFSRVGNYSGMPVVVLRSRRSRMTMDFLALVCQEKPHRESIEGVSAKSLLVVRKDADDKRSIEAIGVAIERV